MEVFYMAVRNDVQQYQEPKMFLTSVGESFIREVLGHEPRILALKFESWAVAKMAGVGEYPRALSLR